MNIVIRCDSSNIIGTGHVMRCLNLAEYYPENKYTFICKRFNNNIADKIKSAGHKLICLNYKIEPVIDDYNTWIGDDLGTELYTMTMLLRTLNPDELIIDHYGYSHLIEKNLCQFVPKITVITDIFNNTHWCDEYINYSSTNITKMKQINRNPHTVIKAGIDNIIINKIFKKCKKNIFNKQIKKIGIMLGGTDPNNITLSIIKKIDEYVIENNINVFIIIGSANINSESINEFIKNKSNYECLNNLIYEQLIEFYMNIDLCIGSLSITAFERLLINVPQICLKIVDNQKDTDNINEFNISNIDNLLDKLIMINSNYSMYNKN